MIEDKKVLIICSVDPRLINNGVSAALNTCYRSSIKLFKEVDVYVHNEKKLIISTTNRMQKCEFGDVDLAKYNVFFLSPFNIAFRYLFLYKEIRKSKVYSFLSDVNSYALIRNFVLGLKFNKIFIKYLFKIPIIYFQEKMIDYYSSNIFLQTSKDVKIFNKYYFSKKSIVFPNSPIFNEINISNLNERDGIGWIVSCSKDYFPLTKWVFNNIIVKVLCKDNNIELRVHGRNSHVLKLFIEQKYPNNEFAITFTEDIENISSFYLSNKIIISPVYKGYGLINRTVEAMYYGCIVIGDSKAFNGIKGAINGENCLIAQNNFDFIKKIKNSYYSKELELMSNSATDVIKSELQIKNNIITLKKLI